MVTALALYAGRALSEFELVGMTTNPDVIAQVLAILNEHDSHLIPPLRSPNHQPPLQIVPDPPRPEGPA